MTYKTYHKIHNIMLIVSIVLFIMGLCGSFAAIILSLILSTCLILSSRVIAECILCGYIKPKIGYEVGLMATNTQKVEKFLCKKCIIAYRVRDSTDIKDIYRDENPYFNCLYDKKKML